MPNFLMPMRFSLPFLVAAVLLLAACSSSERPSASDAAAVRASPLESNQAAAVFAGGCFWCMEPPYEKLTGVVSVTSGYAGGTTANPTYQQVSGGLTDHAEVVRVVYDTTQISYPELLEVFWYNIDPLVAGRQFCDVGEQYRSAVFYGNEAERALAESWKTRLAERFGQPIETEIVPETPFYPAESYHQDYYKKNPERYYSYRQGCRRDARLAQLWGERASR